MGQQKMAKVSVEVRSGAARFRVGVQAETMQRALSVVGKRYPHGEVKVSFPLEAEGFFLEDHAVGRAGLIEPPDRVAA
jgi:hypothetical protein